LSPLSSDHKSRIRGQAGLDRLLDLDGAILDQGANYLVKIVAKKVQPDAGRPYGVAYTLTLHAPDGKRLLGYDNAHAVRSASGPGGRARPPFDHRHSGARIQRYAYSDAATLMEHFWGDVNRLLAQEGVIACPTKRGS
jgi:Family of unknown function (DUF6516)